MKRNIIVYSIVIFLMGIATFYDLSMNTYLYYPSSYFGWFMEHIYVMFPILILPFTMVLLTKQKPNLTSYLFMIMSCAYAAQQLDHYVTQTNLSWVIMIHAVIIWIVMEIILKQINTDFQKRLMPFMLYCCFVLVLSSMIVEVIKVSWGRVRFRSMDGPARFTNWYCPQGITGNKSFPSGHTTAASITLCLLILRNSLSRKYCKTLYVIAFASPMIMAVSRMIMGAHYLSDTVMGFTIVYTVVLFTMPYFNKRFMV